MVGNEISKKLGGFFFSFSILINFIAHCKAYTAHRQCAGAFQKSGITFTFTGSNSSKYFINCIIVRKQKSNSLADVNSV